PLSYMLLTKPLLFLRSGAARPRPRDGQRLQPPAFHANQHLRRGTRHRALAVLQEVHVRRRVHHAQRAIDRERIAGAFDPAAPGEHDLEDVAGRDVVLGLAYRLAEAAAVGEELAAGIERRPRPPRRGRRGTPAAQVGLEAVEDLL